MDGPTAFLWILASYGLGSVSFAYLLVKVIKGYDLRSIGSGNLGATNAARALGVKGAVTIYLLDALKGFGPVMWARHGLDDPMLGVVPMTIAMGCAAFIGHCWPLWHGLRGGKGVATASGAVLALAPAAGGVAFLAFALAVGVFRFVSVGSMAAAVVLPVAFIAIERREATEQPGLSIMTFFLLLTTVVIARHASNIKRIVEGTEDKIFSRTETPVGDPVEDESGTP